MSESVIQLGIIAMNVKATGKFDSKLILYLLSRLQYFVEIWQISYHVLLICTVMPMTIVQVILSVNRGLVSKQFLGAQEKEEAPIYMQKTFVSNQRLQTLSSMVIVQIVGFALVTGKFLTIDSVVSYFTFIEFHCILFGRTFD